MNTSIETYFIRFAQEVDLAALPEAFSLTNENDPHPLCALAAKELQSHILTQQKWQHNFGLAENGEGPVIGKMFGVLVVQNQCNEIGYLAAFSGKLAGSNQHDLFVPPIFDLLEESGFFNKGMQELTAISTEIKKLAAYPDHNKSEIGKLKTKRKAHSVALQNKIFDQYHLLNQAGEQKSLIDIFKEAGYKNPPAGAGECAGPKLLQYAFEQRLKPIALTEFWWGLSPKSATWIHKAFYPCCKEKCEPILKHMLKALGT